MVLIQPRVGQFHQRGVQAQAGATVVPRQTGHDLTVRRRTAPGSMTRGHDHGNGGHEDDDIVAYDQCLHPTSGSRESAVKSARGRNRRRVVGSPDAKRRGKTLSRGGSIALALTAATSLVAVLAYVFPRQADPTPAPPPQPREGSVKIRAYNTLYYPDGGVLSEVPPPAYPTSERRGHCDEWADWAHGVGAAPAISTLDIGTRANVTSPITITDFQLDVRDSAPMVGSARIRCQYGAGGAIGSQLLFDLENPTRRTPMDVDGDSEADTTIPGGVFVVDTSRSETLTIIFSGKNNYVYDFTVRMQVVENGIERTEQFGTSSQPLRIALTDYTQNVTEYDWDVEAEEWLETAG